MTTEITRSVLKSIRTDLEIALNEISAKYGIEITAGNASFRADSFSMKIEGRIDGAEDKVLKTLRNLSFMYGLNGDICNAVINLQGVDYKVVGLKRTNALIRRVSDNKIFLYKMDSLSQDVKENYPQYLL